METKLILISSSANIFIPFFVFTIPSELSGAEVNYIMGYLIPQQSRKLRLRDV